MANTKSAETKTEKGWENDSSKLLCETEDGKISASDLHNMKAELVPGPKRKVAMLVAYCGENYRGLQMNRSDRSLKTIEKEFFSAVSKAKLVLPNCAIDPSKMGYKCASRTDKGVSTCGQILSMKMIYNERAVELVNQHLPKDIRVLAMKRTTKNFNAQHLATARTYTYTAPTFAFARDADCSYRITKEKLAEVSVLLKRYLGTHPYHNFTSGKTMGEMSAKRYIMSFDFEQPFVHHDIEFITFKLKGQSFMIHQIRKMIGLVICITTGYADLEHMERAFTMPRADVPIAPGHGLVLNQVHYGNYNKHYGSTYGSLDFDECCEERMEFLRERIMPSIYKQEKDLCSMSNWMETLAHHDFTEDGGERERSQLLKRAREIQKEVEDKVEPKRAKLKTDEDESSDDKLATSTS